MDSDVPFNLDIPSEPDFSDSELVLDDDLDARTAQPVASTSKQTLSSSSRVIDLDSSDNDEPLYVQPTSSRKASSTIKGNGTSFGLTDEEKQKLEQLESEINSVSNQISTLQEYRDTLQADRQKLKAKHMPLANLVSHVKDAAASKTTANFLTQKFAWSKLMKKTVKDVWNIGKFLPAVFGHRPHLD